MHITNTLKVKLNSQQKTKASWLVTTVKAILKTPIQKFKNPMLFLMITHDAAVRNSKILASLKGDLGASIAAQKYIPVNYRSEFRDIAALEKIFFYHEDRTNIINIIQQGSHYHLDPIEEETRKSDLDAIIHRVNHKSPHSKLNSAVLDKALSKEIDHG